MVLTDKYDVVGFNMYVDNDLCVFVVIGDEWWAMNNARVNIKHSNQICT